MANYYYTPFTSDVAERSGVTDRGGADGGGLFPLPGVADKGAQTASPEYLTTELEADVRCSLLNAPVQSSVSCRNEHLPVCLPACVSISC